MLNSICIFGDSVAKGVVLNSDAGRYALLKDSFANRIAAEKKIEAGFNPKFFKLPERLCEGNPCRKSSEC
mgnify:CR=1 FL=1